VHGGIVLDFSQWTNKLEIYPEDLVIKVSPGVKTEDIHELAEAHNLMYAPDPSSARICTIGGNLAENAGGPRGVKYGVTKDYVVGLEVVTASGKIIKTESSTVKNVTGYDMTKLLVGSEGTLGIITEAILRLINKVEDYDNLNLPRDAAAIILIEVDGHPDILTQELNTIKNSLIEIGVTNIQVAESKEEEEKLWKIRQLVSPAIVSSGYTKISE